jgi:3-hydroxyacyl-[acyl-carrier-protein] dehydratase
VKLTPREVFDLVPHRPPFLFIDRLLAVDERGAVGEYTFKQDEFFYEGHFPGDAVTPGVILAEAMGQTGLVALGIYLLALEASAHELRETVTLPTGANVEFERVVRPGEGIRVVAEAVSWRRPRLECKVTMCLFDGTPVASGSMIGVGVPRGPSE